MFMRRDLIPNGLSPGYMYKTDLHFAPWTLATRPRLASDDRHLDTMPDRMEDNSAINGVGTTS